MASLFNDRNRLVEGWYWALPSGALARGRAKAVTLAGRELVVYRGEDGRVAALDAYCPHMGAHLVEGRVEGNELRCFFHRWRYDRAGRCTDVPSLGGCPPFTARVAAWPVAERYGLVWVWAGETPRHPLPEVPELEGAECIARLGNRFVKNCHPHVVLINAIDAHHFNSVHDLPVALRMEPREIDGARIEVRNVSRVESTTAVRRLVARFYRGPLTYSMTYFHGSTGTVTLGPDALHFHIVFALRPTADGRTEGQTILVTRRRRGILGALTARSLLWLTALVGWYFARGDTRVFQTIRFDLKTPVAADRAILAFIRHLERQPVSSWSGTASPRTTEVGGANGERRRVRDTRTDGAHGDLALELETDVHG